jgi:hypothetical protein
MSYESGVKFADMNFQKEKGSDPDIVKDQTSKSDQKDTECTLNYSPFANAYFKDV